MTYTNRLSRNASQTESGVVQRGGCSQKEWPLDSVIQHIDKLLLKCGIIDDQNYEIYLERELSQILPIAELIERLEFSEGTVMLCGTILAIGRGRAAKSYHMIQGDTVNEWKVELSYVVESLPIVA